MSKLTIRERLVQALALAGHNLQVSAVTRKYIVFARKDRPGTFFYVGKAGALRSGKTVKDSIPVNNLKAMFLAESDAHNSKA